MFMFIFSCRQKWRGSTGLLTILSYRIRRGDNNRWEVFEILWLIWGLGYLHIVFVLVSCRDELLFLRVCYALLSGSFLLLGQLTVIGRWWVVVSCFNFMARSLSFVVHGRFLWIVGRHDNKISMRVRGKLSSASDDIHRMPTLFGYKIE